MGHFLPFYIPHPPLKTQEIRILKKWKKLLDISSFYTRVPKTIIIWGTAPGIWSDTDRMFLSFWSIFFPFTPLTTDKIKILKKWKKHLEMSSFYTCVPKIMIIWCILPKIWSARDKFFVILGHFLVFHTTIDPRKLKFGKNIKNFWRFYLSQLSQQFSLQTILRKTKWKKIPKKIQNSLFWGPFWPKYKQKWNFCKY